MDNNNFYIKIVAELEKKGIKSTLKQIQELVKKYSLEIVPDLQTKSLRNQFKLVCKEMANDFNKTFGTNITGNDMFKAFENQIKNANENIKQLTNSYQTLKNLEIKKESFDLSKDGNKLEELDKQINQANSDYKSLLDSINKNANFDSTVWNEIKNNIDTATESRIQYNKAKQNDELSKLKTQIQGLETEASQLAEASKIQLLMDNGHGASAYQNQINSIIASLEHYGVETKEAQNITASLQFTLDNMKGLSGQELVAQADKLEQEFKAVKISVEKAKLSYDKLMQPASKEEITSTLLKVQKLLNNNTRVTEEVKQEWQNYVNKLSTGSDIAEKEIKDINIRLNETESKMRSMNRLGTSWTEKFKKIRDKFSAFGSATGATMAIGNQLQKIPYEVYEIDTAMTDLYKVTDETANKYTQFFNSTSDSAHDLGRSISSLVEQTANWAKLGFSLDEAEQLAKISSIYANVGEVDDDTAISDMVTAMKAFNIEASDSITIVDKLYKLGSEYTTSAADLGDGLSRSASAMATSGTDINKTLAMLTGGAEITQNASEFGNFLKIGSMRIRGMKGNLEELGEEVDETVDSISKVQTQILNRTGGKVNIFDDMGNFRDYYDIMEDISKVYNDLNDTDKADLTEILFGKQGGDQGAALIQAFQSGQIQKALESSLNAEGSAMEGQERWLESLEAKTQQFEAAFQSLSATVLDSDLLKWFVDLGTGVVSTLDSIISKMGSFGSIGLGAGLLTGVKNVGSPKMFGLYNVLNIPTVC